MGDHHTIKQDDAIDGAVKDIGNTRDRLTTLGRRLDSQIMGYRNRWQGEAGDSFFGLHQLWIQKQTTITNALNELISGLENTRKVGTGTNQDVAGRLRSASSSLDALSTRLG
ncbi:MAG: WXG100 family type VII secretion target [Nocardioides sp.]|uniref:WXG100 family type VII secretion target n=1 Tax=Nocardioides sp. TaxID=35761 RepID=UPI0039E5589F